ncbi:MAG: DUF3047 domain-containing protein [Nitrospirae bacterium]|nr:DUF3047 domain-containing protein [Nitrospirota bacterium]
MRNRTVIKARISLFFIFVSSLFIICLSAPGAADAPPVSLGFSGPVSPEGIPSPWELKVKKGKADAKVVLENGEPALHMKSLKSSFSLEREFRLNVKDYPYVTWAWKALTLPLRGDVRKGSTNDQGLQFFVAFEGRKILSYVWDTNAPEGTVTEESVPWPVSLTIKVIVVKSGISDTGKWLTVRRNVYDDYRKFFNEEPPRVEGIRVQMNTQHTGGSAEGFFRNIIFSKTSR